MAKLEVLGSGCSVDLTKDEADALWTRVRVASDLLASHVSSSAARNPLMTRGSSGGSLRR
jgi:Trp operon repressor